MADKYQVLVNVDGKHAVIEQTTNGSGKELWNVCVPDAGPRTTATRIARLLNDEYERDQAKRAQREPSEI